MPIYDLFLAQYYPVLEKTLFSVSSFVLDVPWITPIGLYLTYSMCLQAPEGICLPVASSKVTGAWFQQASIPLGIDCWEMTRFWNSSKTFRISIVTAVACANEEIPSRSILKITVDSWACESTLRLCVLSWKVCFFASVMDSLRKWFTAWTRNA